MRKIICINENWLFSKNIQAKEKECEKINLPHTWNVKDGQDGGNDYYRGKCLYNKKLGKIELEENEEAYLEFNAVNQVGEVYFNGNFLAKHLGGYSRWRVNLTPYLNETNEIKVYVDNSPSREVYPQRADFTFYGGIYRDVNLLIVPKVHFSLSYFGGNGIQIEPHNDGGVEITAYLEGGESHLLFEILEQGKVIVSTELDSKNGLAKAKLKVENPHLWNGLDDPYLYEARISSKEDSISDHFGFREYSIDPEKGFFLNGKSYRLVGAARHQDWKDLGYALKKENHEEDIKLILEMGANTLRLAHYQHDPYFYELCDRAGLIVWAEIPYISEHMKEANDNSKSQLKELIIQNYNHPSIVVWGLSNEITVAGGINDNMLKNHQELNDLAHQLDPNRKTTMANLFMLETNSPLVNLPDVRSYNLYYGWYVGEAKDNDQWFDSFHKQYPNLAIGLSEYGADANPNYQAESPVKGDYSETYQAEYHEHMLKMWESRPYIWAMHVWNMFDFAADARDEGGKKGENQKGLITFDRKIKKDAFYIYKAYLSKEKFVHICGHRYVDRAVEKTKVKVYSNLSPISLYLDGKLFESKESEKVFTFDVPLTGEHEIEARSADCSDLIHVRKVKEPNPAYICKGKIEVVNWFDEKFETKDGYFSIYDSVSSIKAHPVAGMVYGKMMQEAMKSFGDVARNVKIPEEMQKKMDAMSLAASLKMAGHMIKPAMVKALNDTLIKIKK